MRIRYLIVSGLAAIALTVTACGGGGIETATFGVDAPPPEETDAGGEKMASAAEGGEKPEVKVPSGEPPRKLVTEDLEEGDGAVAQAGDQVSVNYVGVSYSNGEEFDNSYDRGQPFEFTLGEGQVIPGWDRGVAGMKVGGQRKLIIPPGLAYGAQGSLPSIKPNETLVFVVDLVDVK
ncbi:MAG: FKBP-type peptidyl-prolyl cis-trans isomerase [Thermoleophilaceae bacterium]